MLPPQPAQSQQYPQQSKLKPRRNNYHGMDISNRGAHRDMHVLAKDHENLNHIVLWVIISVFSLYAKTLVDFGALHSFLSHTFSKSLGLDFDIITWSLVVITLVRGRVELKCICRDCSIDIARYIDIFDLFLLEMVDLDIILGMNWLSQHKAYGFDKERKQIRDKSDSD